MSREKYFFESVRPFAMDFDNRCGYMAGNRVKVFKTLNGRQSHILSKFHKSKKFSRSELS